MTTVNLTEKKNALFAAIACHPRAAVAFNGGEDSLLIAAAMVEVLGSENAVAVIATSDLNPKRERKLAAELARAVGIPLIECKIDIFSHPNVIENNAKRCYYCKRLLYTAMRDKVLAEGYDVLFDGSDFDDSIETRPGRIAVRELGITNPLAELGLTRPQARQLCAMMGVPTANCVSLSCLATRLPCGAAITRGKLQQIDKAEMALEDMGFSDVRVRHHGDVARIEMRLHGDIERAALGNTPKEIAKVVRSCSRFAFVTLDLEGYRRGSLNNAIMHDD